MRDPLLGSVLAGRFQILRMLGEGAMGQVYLAEQSVIGRQVVVKVLRPELAGEEIIVERFRREARAASRLDHRNIVYVIDFGQTEDRRFYLVMEYIPGSSLRECISGSAPGPIPLTRSLDILSQICKALAVAHDAGVIHRDLKPENILIGRTHSEADEVKILDFGLAKIVAGTEYERTLTSRGEIYGTPAYMSPEQASGEPVDTRTDIYSFGAIAFELLSGSVPFHGKNLAALLIAQISSPAPRLSSVRPRGEEPLPDELEATVMKCLEKDREQRPTRIAEPLRVIDSLLKKRGLKKTERQSFFTIAPMVQSAGLDDWDEKTSDYSSPTSVSAGQSDLAASEPGTQLHQMGTSHGTSEPPRTSEVQGSQNDAELPRDATPEWIWSQICKKARSLADALRDRRLAPIEITQSLIALNRIEERVLAEETELALLRSSLEDLEQSRRDREARLRYACVDLSIERSRLLEDGTAGAKLIQDLSYQITELEQRLAEIEGESESRKLQLTAQLSAAQNKVSAVQTEQNELELKLLGLLQQARASVVDEGMLRRFDRLQGLINHLSRSSTVMGK